MSVKTCKRCGETKPLAEFGKETKQPDGIRVYCKPCTNKMNKESKERKNKPLSKFDPLNVEWLKDNLTRTRCCKNCNGFFETKIGRAHLNKFCSDECRYEHNYINQTDAVVKKAIVIGANILMGKGKKDFLVRLISDALNTPCPYCGVELTLENISLDHKEAYGSTELRRNKKENKELRAKMDRKENLHLVCKECNTLKMDMDHEDYLEFLKFFEGRQKARNSVFRRLKMSVNPYRRR